MVDRLIFLFIHETSGEFWGYPGLQHFMELWETTSIDTGDGQLFKQSYAQFLQVNSLFPTLDERENLQEI